MYKDNKPSPSQELKSLTVLHSLLAYALRELAQLDADCTDTEVAITAALTAVRDQIAIEQLKSAMRSDANEQDSTLH